MHKQYKEIYTTTNDTLIFNELCSNFRNKNLSLHEYIVSVGNFFIGTSYIASTLETDREEHLVINLHEMDCVTFVEYVTALSISFYKKQYKFENFVEILTMIRYRSGIIDGYTSRLHYFSEWLQNNTQKGFLNIVSNTIGDAIFDKKVNFMTANSHLYKQLKDSAVINQLKIIEDCISSYSIKYITKNNIKNIENEIKSGDIIAFTSSIKGLDVSHVGFAVHENGKLYLLHASSDTKKVEVTSLLLVDYIINRKNITGILIGRVSCEKF